jgi:hypothetical protein
LPLRALRQSRSDAAEKNQARCDGGGDVFLHKLWPDGAATEESGQSTFKNPGCQ